MSTPTELFDLSDELTFRRNFVTQFLASWCAENFNDYCARGMQERLQAPPVEDAEFISGAAWNHWRDTMRPRAKESEPNEPSTIDRLKDRLNEHLKTPSDTTARDLSAYVGKICIEHEAAIKRSHKWAADYIVMMNEVDSVRGKGIQIAIAELTRRLKAKGDVTHMVDITVGAPH